MTTKDKEEFKAIIKEYQNNTDLLVEKLAKESKDSTDALVERLNEKTKQEIEHYIGALSESHQHTLDAIKEQTDDIPEIKRMVGIMFENMGKQEVEIVVLKESARDHERRLQKIER